MADMTTDFADLERDTRVEGSDGRYTTVISPHWVVWSPQGGYLMALLLRAAGAASEFGKPLSLARGDANVLVTAKHEFEVGPKDDQPIDENDALGPLSLEESEAILQRVLADLDRKKAEPEG